MEYAKWKKGKDAKENGEFICLCGGGDPDIDDFHACFKDGRLTNNPPDRDGRYYVVCEGCGRIIDCDNLQVVGRRDVDELDSELDRL